MGYLSKRDYYAMGFISVFPFLFFVGLDLMYDGNLDHNLNEGLVSIAYSAIITIGLYFINSGIIRWLQVHHPWQNGVWKRIFMEAGLSFVLSAAYQAFIIFLSLEYMKGYVSNVRAHYISNIVFGLTITFIVVLIMEGVYFFRLWRDSLNRVQKLEKQQLQAEIDQLKAQVQPHFLFNSLNTLSAMLEIEKDIPRAIKFIDEFSLLYRRLLEHKERELVTLGEELRFVKAYLTLQKERFSSALEVQLSIPEEKLEDYILPLAIQELVENAIKHNRMSRSEPLVIKVQTDLTHLCVSNPCRPKSGEVKGTGTGLENLKMRLGLLGAPPMKIKKGEAFEVCIPLIPPAVAFQQFQSTESLSS